MSRTLLIWIAMVIVALGFGAFADQSHAQTWGGYGQGFTPSPQPVYDGWGRNVGVIRVDQQYYGGGYQGYGGFGGSGIAITIGTRYGGVTYWRNQREPHWCHRCGRWHH